MKGSCPRLEGGKGKENQQGLAQLTGRHGRREASSSAGRFTSCLLEEMGLPLVGARLPGLKMYTLYCRPNFKHDTQFCSCKLLLFLRRRYGRAGKQVGGQEQ